MGDYFILRKYQNMNYLDFENLFSAPRLQRYKNAMSDNEDKALILYRYNLKLSQSLFTLISVFEIVLRNQIDNCMKNNGAGTDWLHDAIQSGGIFDTRPCQYCHDEIRKKWQKLQQDSVYSHDKLIAELNFGFWRYMLEPAQFNATGRIFMQILPNRPRSTPTQHYNQKWFAAKLREINVVRNRIAHQETICLHKNGANSVVDTSLARNVYQHILNLLNYMNIDADKLLHGLHHKNILTLCHQIDQL